MTKRDEQVDGPEAASPLRRALPEGGAPPLLGEARTLRVERLDGTPPRPRYVFPESFAFGPPAGTGERQWASSLVAAMLSLTLAASMIALAFVGGVTPRSEGDGPESLRSEAVGPTVRVPGTAPAPQASGGNAPAETVTLPTEALPAEGASAGAAGVPPSSESPVPPVVNIGGGPGMEQGDEGSGGTTGGDAGGAGGGQTGGDQDEGGGIIGGDDGIGIDTGGPPRPVPVPGEEGGGPDDTNGGQVEGEEDEPDVDEGDGNDHGDEDPDADEGEEDEDEPAVDEGDGSDHGDEDPDADEGEDNDGDEGDGSDDEGEDEQEEPDDEDDHTADTEMPPAVGSCKDDDGEADAEDD